MVVPTDRIRAGSGAVEEQPDPTAPRGKPARSTGRNRSRWRPPLQSNQSHGRTGATLGKSGAGRLRTTTRHMTYKDYPLCCFLRDEDDRDAYRQDVHAFGAGRYVVAPSANKVDNA